MEPKLKESSKRPNAIPGIFKNYKIIIFEERINLENYKIPLEEIIRATKNFSSETRVGDGGFGVVYRGQLSEHWNNCLVAIKRLNWDGFQGNKEFHSELKMVSSFNHPNIIPFVGYCEDANEKIIVYKYATNGSLDHHLQDPQRRRRLTWEQRVKICLGAARGIQYLHSGVGEHSRVIHRDVKSANILLDDNLEAKICDFGLSRSGPRNQSDTNVRTRACGTRHYIDPVYSERGMLSKESDIYSFGVVMFEMSSGKMAYYTRRIADGKDRYLIDLVRTYYDEKTHNDGGLTNLIDPAIRCQIDLLSLHKFNTIAHECINWDVKKRPTMDTIIERVEEVLNIQGNFVNVWKQFLPPDYLYLSDSDIPLGYGYMSFEIDGKKCYMLGAKDLDITWQHDTRYWEREHFSESRFPEVYILRKVWAFEIHGSISVAMLSRNCTYVVYLLFQTRKDSMGLAVPATARLKFRGIRTKTKNVYLQRPETYEENSVFPYRRNDGWMEIKLVEFKCNEGDYGEVEMALYDRETRKRKGLIIEGIELRPK